MLFAYSPIPYLNSDFGGMLGMIVFLLGIILIALRWNH
jgi:hypothetical protein